MEADDKMWKHLLSDYAKQDTGGFRGLTAR